MDGCEKKQRSRGMCRGHYTRWGRGKRGEELEKPMQPRGEPLEKRLYSKIKKVDGCWVWQGSTRNDYGQLKHEGRNLSTHVWSWKVTNGDIPEGLFVCHACDDPPCINPDHLFLGTQADNLRDMSEKGRGRKGRFTDEQVRAIRKDPRLHRVIADEYGVDRSEIWKIKNRKNYAWVSEE